MNEPMNIINITKIFPEDQFEVTIKEHSSSSSSTITVRSRTTPATGICLQLIITPLETIVVSGLAKCNGVTQNEGSGAALMLKVKQLAKTLKINTIQLYDDSKVRVCDGNGNNTEIDLFRLKILTKGESWYNSLGYKSEYYAEEIEHNREVITSPMSKVASELKLKLNLDTEPLPDETVQQYITRLLELQHTHPHPPCEHENGAYYLKHVIDNVSKLLWYERMLEKKIRMRSSSSKSKSGGIRRRRRRTRKTPTNTNQRQLNQPNHRNQPTPTAWRNSWSKKRDSV
jgi:hypothetical protein